MSIFLDDIAISKNIFTPWTTLPALVIITSLLSGALWWLARNRALIAYGILFFFIGHLLESSIFGLILGYEHRNYLPGIGILLAVTVWAATNIPTRLHVPLALSAFALCAALLIIRSISWSTADHMAIDLALHRPNSPAANMQVASHWRKTAYTSSTPAQQAEFFGRARHHFLAATELSTNSINPLMGLLTLPATAAERDQYWRILQQRLAHEQPDANTVNSLVHMLSCAIKHPDCPFEAAQLDHALDAMMANPQLIRRRHLQYAGGAFKVRVQHNYQDGLALSQAATKDGNPRHLASHLYNLVLAGHGPAAEQLFLQWQTAGLLPDQHAVSSARQALAGTAPY